MIITHFASINLAVRGVPPHVDVMQGDKYSRDILVALTEAGIDREIPEGATAIVYFAKPDGTGGSYDKLPDGSSACSFLANMVTVHLAPQVCTVAGLVKLSVCLMVDGTEMYTFPIHIHVHPTPGFNAKSEDYYNPALGFYDIDLTALQIELAPAGTSRAILSDDIAKTDTLLTSLSVGKTLRLVLKRSEEGTVRIPLWVIGTEGNVTRCSGMLSECSDGEGAASCSTLTLEVSKLEGTVELLCGSGVPAGTSDELTLAINQALAEAKASGLFDGEDGNTPVVGKDYFTEADKADMVNRVIAAFDNLDEVSY